VHAHAPPGAPRLEIAAIFRAYGGSFRENHRLSPAEQRVLGDLERCRTAALGGHLYRCTQCAAEVPLYNSCLNRHCPTCQGPAQFRWVTGRKERLLPTDYFHVVFTLPALLRPLVRRYRRLLFDLLFAAAANTLLTFGRDPKRLGAEIGFTLVLHTWTRDLRFHPHVHAIVTGGGLDLAANRWVSARQDYLFPVQALSRLFRGKFLDALIDLFAAGAPKDSGHDPKSFRTLTRRLARQEWVVYAKKPFGGPEQIVTYLGLYTHRVAISNTRLLSITHDLITFRTRGEGSCTITPEEFVRRFLLHVLPEQFVKIRHYGLLAPANVNTRLRRAAELLAQQRNAAPSSTDLADAGADTDGEHHVQTISDPTRPRCPHCGASALIPVGIRRTGHRRARCNSPPPDT
jgi:Putative transposase/Transposase zinc-binding domain